MLVRPDASEFNSYFARYVDLITEGDVAELLKAQNTELIELIDGLDETQGDYRYAPDKWSVKELIGHMTETERVMSYRLMTASKGDKSPLPGFDQDLFIQNGSFDQLSLAVLKEDSALVRQATLSLFRTLNDEAWTRQGIVNNHATSARALAYIIAGHERHHLKVLKERYISKN